MPATAKSKLLLLESKINNCAGRIEYIKKAIETDIYLLTENPDLNIKFHEDRIKSYKKIKKQLKRKLKKYMQKLDSSA